jgi:hypothetical protein
MYSCIRLCNAHHLLKMMQCEGNGVPPTGFSSLFCSCFCFICYHADRCYWNIPRDVKRVSGASCAWLDRVLFHLLSAADRRFWNIPRDVKRVSIASCAWLGFSSQLTCNLLWRPVLEINTLTGDVIGVGSLSHARVSRFTSTIVFVLQH